MTQIWTIRKLLTWTSDYFHQTGVTSARLDAEILLAFCLGVRRIDLYLDMDRPVTEDERVKFKKAIMLRRKRMPIAYIIGLKEFWSLDFLVDRSVLIPRPDTELLVDICCNRLSINKDSAEILDLATGSGCIAVAVAKQLAGAQIWATDSSDRALLVAVKNANNHGLQHQIHFIRSVWFEELATNYSNLRFDVILSNPPYIPEKEIENLAPEIRMYEPIQALNGGIHGIDAYPAIALGAMQFLKPGGFLCVEIGYNIGAAVADILKDTGFVGICIESDLANHERVVIGVKPQERKTDG